MEVTREYRARFEPAVINQAYDKFRSKYKSWALKARFFEIERGNDRVELSSFDEFVAEVPKADGYRYGYFDAEWYLKVECWKSGVTYVSVSLKNKEDIDSILEIFNASEVPETPGKSSKDTVTPTYSAPQVKRKIAPTLPPPPTTTFKPEPTLDLFEYEHILSVISNMVLVMERSPQAFKGMKEEDLRQHFLVQLNGQYEGQATGETFNFQGKTDILIRVEGKNIFVAECKFWGGPEKLKEALNQLLGYATWRDSKLALLVFNRDRSLSSVLAKIPEVFKAHKNFKRQVDYKSDTGFRYIFGHPDDSGRELTLTVLTFEVPA